MIVSEIDSMVQEGAMKIPAFLNFRFDYKNDDHTIYLDLNIKIGNEHLYHTQLIDIYSTSDTSLYKVIKSF